MRMNNKLLLATIVLTLSACSLFFGSSEEKIKKDNSYSFAFHHQDWKSLPPNETDYAFSGPNGDILLANSFCHEFQHEPLEKLALKTLQSINQAKLVSGKELTFKGRQAYEALAEGIVDGVSIKLKIQNYRRNHCYYDFVLITQQLTDENSKTFDQFTQSIEFK